MLLDSASGVTLASDQKAPFALRRTFFPAVRKTTESAESRFVIYLTEPGADGVKLPERDSSGPG